MNHFKLYENLRFDRRIPVIPRSIIPLGITFVIFSGLWLLLPPAMLYWLLLPFMLVLVWLAGYGWRQGLADLIAFLQRLERLSQGGPT